MICKQCGAQIEDTAAECKFCGAVYEENIKPEEPEKAPESEQTAPAAPADEESLGADQPENNIDEMLDENEIKRRRQMERLRAEKQSQLEEIERRRKEKKLKQRRNKILTVLIALIAVGGIGTGSYYLVKNHQKGPDVVISTQQPVVDDPTVPTTDPLPVVSAELPSDSPTEAAESSGSGEGTVWHATGGSGGSSSSGSGSSGSSSSSNGGSGSSSSGSGSSGGSGSSSGGSGSSGSSSSSSSSSSSGGGSATASSGGQSFTVSTPSFGSGAEYKADGGYSGGRFNAALITGVEVVKNGSKNYMIFKFNGATYYANVSADTTTEYVKGRPMTINAFKTSETYNGNDIYEITVITNYSGKYIFPNSGFKRLTEADLEGKSARELLLGRNEIYARHGRRFQTPEIRAYFESCSWYKVKDSYNYDDDYSNLNSIEAENAEFIKAYEDKHFGSN